MYRIIIKCTLPWITPPLLVNILKSITLVMAHCKEHPRKERTLVVLRGETSHPFQREASAPLSFLHEKKKKWNSSDCPGGHYIEQVDQKFGMILLPLPLSPVLRLTKVSSLATPHQNVHFFSLLLTFWPAAAEIKRRKNRVCHTEYLDGHLRAVRTFSSANHVIPRDSDKCNSSWTLV